MVDLSIYAGLRRLSLRAIAVRAPSSMLTRLGFSDLHAPDQAVLYEVDMLDHLIRYDISGPVVDDLMDIDNDAPTRIGAETSRFDMGINEAPLAGPVLAHSAMAMYTPTFHPIRPVDLRMHGS
jgi:hypothetical protein